MQITYSQLKSQTPKFWNQLCFILQLSPYFNKLGWGFSTDFEEQSFCHKKEISPELHKLFLNAITSDQNEEQICRQLIKTIFRLSANYSRPDPVFDPETNWHDISSDPHLTNLSYLRYCKGFVGSFPWNIENIPLTDSDITLQDVQMLKNKLIVLLTSWNEKMIDACKLQSEKLSLVKTKLTKWQKLLKPHG